MRFEYTFSSTEILAECWLPHAGFIAGESCSVLGKGGKLQMAERTIIIQKCDEMSVAKYFAVFGMIWGIVMGVLLALNIGAGAPVMGLGSDRSVVAMVGAFFMMIIVGSILFFVTGLVTSCVYNIVAERTGGIHMKVEIPAE